MVTIYVKDVKIFPNETVELTGSGSIPPWGGDELKVIHGHGWRVDGKIARSDRPSDQYTIHFSFGEGGGGVEWRKEPDGRNVVSVGGGFDCKFSSSDGSDFYDTVGCRDMT